MLHILTILILSAVIFSIAWWGLGLKGAFDRLARDEVAELERELRSEEELLETLPAEGRNDAADLLRTHGRERIAELRRRLARARGEPRASEPGETVH